MSIQQWIPNYIKKTLNYNPKDILTAQEFNAILNLLITQGDYNSSWLDYLQTQGIPDAIADMSATEIAAAISTAVQQEIAALTASVINKTSAQLNAPMFTLLNTGYGITGINSFKTLIDSKNMKFTNAVPINLIDTSTAYPTKQQLLNLKTAGEDIVAYSVNDVPLSGSDPSLANTINLAYTYMHNNTFNDKVFVYPSGTSDADVISAVHEKFNYAVNIAQVDVLDPTGIFADSSATILGNIPIIECNSTSNVATIKALVDDIVEHNYYMILKVNTDSAQYDATKLAEILDYVNTMTSIEYPDSIDAAMTAIHNTIDNNIEVLKRLTVQYIDGEAYIVW